VDKHTLQKFCGKTYSEPWTFGGFSYATNGHIVVRAPKLPDVPEGDFLNEKAAVLFDGLDYEDIERELTPIPPLPPVRKDKCTACEGTGKTDVCPECDGDGEVSFENNYSNYVVSCDTCRGKGTIPGNGNACDECGGSGIKPEHTRIPMGRTGFALRYLRLMKNTLSGVEIAPIYPEAACYFRFDGGEGMPVRDLREGR